MTDSPRFAADTTVHVVALDIADLGLINNDLGFEAGDAVITAVHRWLRRQLPGVPVDWDGGRFQAVPSDPDSLDRAHAVCDAAVMVDLGGAAPLRYVALHATCAPIPAGWLDRDAAVVLHRRIVGHDRIVADYGAAVADAVTSGARAALPVPSGTELVDLGDGAWVQRLPAGVAYPFPPTVRAVDPLDGAISYALVGARLGLHPTGTAQVPYAVVTGRWLRLLPLANARPVDAAGDPWWAPPQPV